MVCVCVLSTQLLFACKHIKEASQPTKTGIEGRYFEIVKFITVSITGGQVQARKPNRETRVWVHYEFEGVSEQRVYMCV